MEVVWVSRGQVRAYGDSIYRAEIIGTSGKSFEEIKAFAITEGNKQEKFKEENYIGAANQYTGSCGFPKGLDSFYRIFKKSDDIYILEVCRPYDD